MSNSKNEAFNIPKELMENWAFEYAEKEKIQNLKIQEMLSNTNYIIWLENFTKKYLSFFDDDWFYCPEKYLKKI